jgi:hypothetical protein
MRCVVSDFCICCIPIGVRLCDDTVLYLQVEGGFTGLMLTTASSGHW